MARIESSKRQTSGGRSRERIAHNENDPVSFGRQTGSVIRGKNGNAVNYDEIIGLAGGEQEAIQGGAQQKIAHVADSPPAGEKEKIFDPSRPHEGVKLDLLG